MAAGSGQDLDSWSFWRLTSATSPHVESDFSQTQKLSYAVRFNYSYKGSIYSHFPIVGMEYLGWLINGIVSRQRHWHGVFLMRLLWNQVMIG